MVECFECQMGMELSSPIPKRMYEWDWLVLRTGPLLFTAFAACHLSVFSCFPFLFFPFYSIYGSWYCGAGVFWLIGCQSLSPSLLRPFLVLIIMLLLIIIIIMIIIIQIYINLSPLFNCFCTNIVIFVIACYVYLLNPLIEFILD